MSTACHIQICSITCARVFRSARAYRNYSRVCLDLRGRADSAHGFVILCTQYCNLLARCVHALALFCPTFNAIEGVYRKQL